MSRRWWDALRLASELYGCKARLRAACADRAALLAEQVALGHHNADLEGANAALITEVNVLRDVVRAVQARHEALIAELHTARAINRTQAGILAHQGTELVAAYAALGALLHTAPADPGGAQPAVLAPRGEGA